MTQQPNIEWKITNPGESTAFCDACDVELGLGPIMPCEFNVGGRQDYVCPECNHMFE